jgi:hypothetical protein
MRILPLLIELLKAAWAGLHLTFTLSVQAVGRSAAAGRPPDNWIANYRTQDGSLDYRFQIIRLNDGSFRVYFLDLIGPAGRITVERLLHYFRDDAGGIYLCWSEAIRTFEKAKEIAADWAEATEKYRKHGTAF